jgi:hypothetical protein
MHELTVMFTFLFGFLTPILCGTWIGTLARHPISGFFLGWVFTPITAVVAALLLITTIDAPVATLVAVESPVLGIGTGLISGGFAAFFIHRRLAASEKPPIGDQSKDIVASDSKVQ